MLNNKIIKYISSDEEINMIIHNFINYSINNIAYLLNKQNCRRLLEIKSIYRWRCKIIKVIRNKLNYLWPQSMHIYRKKNVGNKNKSVGER